MRQGVYKGHTQVNVYEASKGTYIVEAIGSSVSFTTSSLVDIKFEDDE